MNEAVLVLNANFEPINVCNTRRAINLMLMGKADMVKNGRGIIRTVSRDYPRPSIIRLAYYIRRPRMRVALSRKEIFRRDNFTCQYCGKQTGHLTVDHVLPRRLGGQNTWENVVAACPSCNHKKGGSRLSETNMHLLRKPQEPSHSMLYFFERYLQNNRDWESYIQGW